VLTFEATFVPLADADIRIFFRTPGTVVWNFTAPVAHVNSSSTGVLLVYVDEVLATETTDYVVTAWGTEPVTQGFITFVTASIPAADAVVSLVWSYAKDNKFTIPESATANEDVEVWFDTTLKTVTTHYAIANNIITVVDAQMPAADVVVKVIYVSKYAGIVPAGGVTFLDPQRLNVPAWDYIRAGGSTVVEVM
jgi:hypothetical protein